LRKKPLRRLAILLRGAWSENRLLAVVVGGCFVIARASTYPIQYLLHLDSDIWFIQVGTWIFLLLEGAGLGLLAALGAAGLRAWFSRFSGAGPFHAAVRSVERFLGSSKAPLAAGALSALFALYAFGSLHPAPVLNDEAAYLLQAKLYSTFRWTAPPAPIPEFFEQMYVFVWPFTAAKYPPGFPLALVPGVWLGIPAIVPVALAGLSGALLFLLAREVADAWLAAIAWLLWTTVPHASLPMPAFMSQHLSTALWLGSFWALLRWWKSGRRRHLLLLALFLGWEAITRPLSMLAVAIPAAVAVAWMTARRHSWRDLGSACVLGLAVLMILPIWCKQTTGSWTLSPLMLHIRWYTPYDAPGFGTRIPEPVRTLPPDMQRATRILSQERRQHTLSRVPWLVVARARQILANSFPGWRSALVVAILLGLLSAPPEALFGFLAALLTFLAHLVVPHLVKLSVYYIETYPILAFLAALGIGQLLTGRRRREGKLVGRFGRMRPGAQAAAFVLLLVMAPAALFDLRAYHVALRNAQEPKVEFRRQLAGIEAPSMVFVRYPPNYPPLVSLIENDPDFVREPVWKVHDLGTRNARLEADAPDRIPYLYVAATHRLIRLPEIRP
jgi:hypothetical protein